MASTLPSHLSVPIFIFPLIGPILSSMIRALESDTSTEWTEDHLWTIINALVTEVQGGRGKVITPLRHALTGRKVSLQRPSSRFSRKASVMIQFLTLPSYRLVMTEWSVNSSCYGGLGERTLPSQASSRVTRLGAGSQGDVRFFVTMMNERCSPGDRIHVHILYIPARTVRRLSTYFAWRSSIAMKSLNVRDMGQRLTIRRLLPH
jgi:hypothetical protein